MRADQASPSSGAAASPARRRRRKRLSPLFKSARDALAACVVFTAVTSPFMSDPSAASPHSLANFVLPQSASPQQAAVAKDTGAPPLVQIATTTSPSSAEAVYRRTSDQAAWALLTLAFSLAVALNLATFRHLRRAYAPKRRHSVRGGLSGT